MPEVLKFFRPKPASEPPASTAPGSESGVDKEAESIDDMPPLIVLSGKPEEEGSGIGGCTRHSTETADGTCSDCDRPFCE